MNYLFGLLKYVFVLKTTTGRPDTIINIILMLHQIRFHTSCNVLKRWFSVAGRAFLCFSCFRGITSLMCLSMDNEVFLITEYDSGQNEHTARHTETCEIFSYLMQYSTGHKPYQTKKRSFSISLLSKLQKCN